MIYETGAVLVSALKETGLFRRVSLISGMDENDQETSGEPSAKVLFVSEQSSSIGGRMGRELVYSIVLRTVSLGRDGDAFKRGADLIDSSLAALLSLPVISWSVEEASADKRSRSWRINVVIRRSFGG
ncbi:hypothetical protein [Limisalsivibrio acetivorans]|uniref:hypothetical protein n=1 Tax=Limisalsivibrio acetivorans TaxID=1304888 RepID=UPI0003B79939|nr:hypothetical protein [Limisalsivibrio acetivorans]